MFSLDTYRLLPKFTQKLGFLLKIQLNLLNQYHGRVSSALDSFEALSLIRSVPVPGAIPEAVSGVMTTPDAGGTLVALRRLNRWRASCRYISKNVHDLAEDDVSDIQELQKESFCSNVLFSCSSSLTCSIRFLSIARMSAMNWRSKVTVYRISFSGSRMILTARNPFLILSFPHSNDWRNGR